MRISFHVLATAVVLLSLTLGSRVHAQKTQLTPEEEQVVNARLGPTVAYERRVKIEAGATLFMEMTFTLPAKKVSGNAVEYDGLITDVRGTKNIVLYKRPDSISMTTRGPNVEVKMTYPMYAKPGASKGGNVWAKIKLVERKGFANVVATKKIRHGVKILPAKPTSVDLAADFRGYRHFKAKARKRRNRLAARGVAGLTLEDQGKPPQLVRVSPQVFIQVDEFIQWRNRMFVAKRHLEAASKSPDRATSSLAKKYLSLLDAPDSALGDLPEVALIPTGAASESGVSVVTGGAAGAAAGSGGGASKPSKPGQIEELTPLETQKEKRPDEETERRRREEEREKEEPEEEEKQEVRVVEDVETLMKRREEHIPLYTRGMLLDDPNVGYSFSFRTNWATVSLRGQEAKVPGMFFGAQAGLTKDLGIELTVPVAYVKLLIDGRNPDLLFMGNPLVALKYRLFLPKVLGRRITLVPRIRWGMAFQQAQQIPTTRQQASVYAVEAHFVDTYAFLLGKHDIGAGVSAAWDWKMIKLGAQMYLDYYLPKDKDIDPLDVWAIGYGISAGVRPLDYLGAFIEARGTALLNGPRRHELFTYLGIKGYITDYIEAAAWTSLPIGTSFDVTGLQFGGELRFVYDVGGLIVRGKGRRNTETRFIE